MVDCTPHIQVRLGWRPAARLASIALVAAVVTVACVSQPHVPEPIKLGSLIDVSAFHAGYVTAGVQAAVKDINRHGGVHGRPLEVVNCDDHRDPNVGLSCARKIAAGGFVATVANLTAFGEIEDPILDEAGIAQVGSYPLVPEDSTTPTAFPIDGGNPEQIAGEILDVKRRGLHSVFFLSPDEPPGVALAAWARLVAKAAGIDYAGQSLALTVASDLSSYVRSAIQSRADVVLLAAPPPTVLPFLAASAAAGARYLIALPYGELQPAQIRQLGGAAGPLENAIEFDAMPPLSATDRFPALRAFEADMDMELSTGDQGAAPSQRTGGQLLAWLSVQVVAHVAAGLPSVGSQSFLQALRTATTVDTLGLTPPWRPNANGPRTAPRVSNPYGYLTTQRNGIEVLEDPSAVNPYQALGLT
jgi:ABC-type branched-subunit amino acid transport system substrate-binding protein